MPRPSQPNLRPPSLRFAASLLAIWFAATTQSSYGQSAVQVKLTSLSLSQAEQENLANYIRSCEVDRSVSELRRQQLESCLAPNRPSSFEFAPTMLMVLISGAIGFALGAHHQ